MKKLLSDNVGGTELNPGGHLALALEAFLSRVLSLSLHVRALLPIWVLHTYVCDLFEFTPYLNVVSPEPGCGKTTTGEVLSALCRKATSPISGTAAVLRRRIAKDGPTLILDEWDTLDPNVRRSCMNFLNTGFRFDGVYAIMSGTKPVELSTFCPKAIIGRAAVSLPEATLSRCISFTIHKALPDEKLEKLRSAQRVEAKSYPRECEKWAREFRRKSLKTSPLMPESLSARQQDICEPLLAIAEDCGGPWPLVLRSALTELFSGQDVITPENELLRAVQRFTQERNEKFFWSGDFCLWANDQEETPWFQRPLTQAKLADMLRGYNVFPKQINRIVNGQQKNGRGYLLEQFQEVFARYINTPQQDR